MWVPDFIFSPEKTGVLEVVMIQIISAFSIAFSAERLMAHFKETSENLSFINSKYLIDCCSLIS